ncbi:helix-turn-helix domain-containing protein [Yinghuangia sp. YIM S09857]|uniref:helix-turn-helix domain-containing protein n=1 Tax=Yinghuangia sp. YIM S09857 TaxID=3436929 RepID=UPI003F52C842
MAGAPNYARRRLGSEMRRLRLEADLSGEDAADACGWDKSKISRIENARVAVSRHDLHVLCRLYGADTGASTRLEGWLTDTRGPRWWSGYTDVISSSYEELIELEGQASEIRTANANLVPGLLQCKSYAAAVFSTGPMIPDPDRADALLEVRMKRQRVLAREDPVKLTAVIAESVLRCEIGGRAGLADQLRHLLEVGSQPNVRIRVLPSASTASAFIGGITLFDFPDNDDLGVLFIEYHGGMLVKDDGRDIRRSRRHLDYLFANALSEEASRQHIAGRLKDL